MTLYIIIKTTFGTPIRFFHRPVLQDKAIISFPCSPLGSDVFSTSTDGEVFWWDIRKLVEPVETLQLEFAGYMPGQRLGGICMEYESTMVS